MIVNDISKDLVDAIRKDAECIAVKSAQISSGASTIYHLHPNTLHITYTKNGKGKCFIGDTEYILKNGTISIVYPYEPHSFSSDNEDPFFNLNLKVCFKGVIPFGFPRLLKTGRKSKKFEKLFRALYNAFHDRTSVACSIRETICLLEIFDFIISLSKESEKGFLESVDEALAESISVLQTPPFIFPGIDVLAYKSGMSRRKYTDFFRKAIGLSPRKFWLKAKMSYAWNLARKHRHSIKEIAMICGYSNSQNFIKAFKEFYGSTPGKL